jgi:putative thioredoxin
MPMLKKLAEESQGAFILAKVNTDRDQALAAQLGVRALPTVKVFRNGQAVEEVVGVQPESVYRAIIKRYEGKASDSLSEQAEVAWQRGKREKSLSLLREALALEPDNHELKISLAEKLLAMDHLEEASEILHNLPLEMRMQEPASALLAQLEFINLAKDAPETATLQATANPSDIATRYQLGARKVLEGDYEAALEHFLEILQRDPKFDDEAGRKALLAVFNILGSDNPLVSTYRRKMFALLH